MVVRSKKAHPGLDLACTSQGSFVSGMTFHPLGIHSCAYPDGNPVENSVENSVENYVENSVENPVVNPNVNHDKIPLYISVEKPC